MASKWIKKLVRTIIPNPLDALLKKAQKKGQTKFLIAWNRGLGDIPLLLSAMVSRIREKIPNASITFLTRENIKEGFFLLEGVEILVDKTWKRNHPYNVVTSLHTLGYREEDFDLVITHPDPNYWIAWQVGTFIPRLRWNKAWDDLSLRFDLPTNQPLIGVQVATETGYNLFRDWPISRWNELFSYFEKQNKKIVLLGIEKQPKFNEQNIIDLRGETTPLEMLSIIKKYCSTLILPDSAILALVYYLDLNFPIDIVSIWADPTLGVLKQNVLSPNPSLVHQPLIAEDRDLHSISTQQAIDALKEMGHG